MSDGSAFQARDPAMENNLSRYMKTGTWNDEVAAHTGPKPDKFWQILWASSTVIDVKH